MERSATAAGAAGGCRATKRRFDLGDEVCIAGVVRLLDAAGDRTVTIEIHATGQRITLRRDENTLELVAKGPKARRPSWRRASHGPENQSYDFSAADGMSLSVASFAFWAVRLAGIGTGR